MFSPFDTNPTQVTGLIVFFASALSCGWAVRRTSGRTAVLWRCLAVVQCLFLAEIVFGLRHQVHGGVDAVLQQQGWYGNRRPVQVALLALSFAGLGFAAKSMLRMFAGSPSVRLAAIASLGLLALFGLETISLHQIDSVLYRPVGSVALVGWVWVALGAMVMWAATRSR
jgi:hypothetical protein